MSNTLFWLTASIILTAVIWLPYVLDRVVVQGLFGAMGYDDSLAQGSAWAQRAKKAHSNAVENLVLFAPLVLIHHASTAGVEDPQVATAAMAYFTFRLLHYVVFVAKLPVVRTLTFFGGWVATVFVALRILGVA